jgi:hypothetical protein
VGVRVDGVCELSTKIPRLRSAAEASIMIYTAT